MKIVFLDAATLGEDANFSELEELGTLVSYPLTDASDVKPRIKDTNVIIVNKVKIGKEEIDSAKNLKLICVAATGTNNVDEEYAKKAGIPVKNVVNYSTESVAQITFGSLLALVNGTNYFDSVVKDGSYSKSNHFTDTGRSFFELKGKNFGIIGMGNIGKRVAAIASSFGCNVFYYSTGGVAHYKKYPSVGLSELIAKSDIISIHAPLNEKTQNLISLKELKAMKTSALLINMGRGGIVNEKELAQALNYGLIAGAVIDVYQDEPIPEGHPYLSLKNPEKIVLTPHIGWASIEARKLLIEKLVQNIKSVCK